MAPPEQFVLLGDSITQMGNGQSRGFALLAELQDAYVRRLDIVNRGLSGYNTDHALEVLERILPTPEQASMRFLTIWFGANDANKNPTMEQYVPLSQFKSNLTKMITHPSVKAHKPNIILITPPPVEETLLEALLIEWGATGETRKAVDAAEYAAAVREVAKDNDVALLDVWQLCMEKAGYKAGDVLPGSKELGKNEVLAEFLYDGLHLGGAGYKVAFDGLAKLIKEKWPEYPPYMMPYKVKVGWEKEQGDKLWDVAEPTVS